MAARVRVFAVNRGGETFDCAEKELTVFFGGALEISDEAFDLVGHQIERLAKLAEFCAAAHIDALREVSGRDALRTNCQFLHGLRQLLGEDETNQQREDRGE